MMQKSICFYTGSYWVKQGMKVDDMYVCNVYGKRREKINLKKFALPLDFLRIIWYTCIVQ